MNENKTKQFVHVKHNFHFSNERNIKEKENLVKHLILEHQDHLSKGKLVKDVDTFSECFRSIFKKKCTKMSETEII